MNDWLQFLEDTVTKIRGSLAVVLDASGCREGWLQGEFFREGRQLGLGLRVNDYPIGDGANADLCCGDPTEMVAEVRIVSALDSTKMKWLVERDVDRMRGQKRLGLDAYMILVVPDREGTGKLADYLEACNFSTVFRKIQHPGFQLKVWRL